LFLKCVDVILLFKFHVPTSSSFVICHPAISPPLTACKYPSLVTEKLPLPNLIYGVDKSINMPALLSDSLIVPSSSIILSLSGKPLSSK
jgi:hypothetical protein